jgi:hypothetical protein
VREEVHRFDARIAGHPLDTRQKGRVIEGGGGGQERVNVGV